MKVIFNSKYRNYFLVGLLFIVVSAYFGVGSHHPDEYFQIYEFANYKLGNTPISDLPWEFSEKMRPTFQATFTYRFIQLCNLIGIHSPYTISMVLRLIIGFLMWLISSLIVLKIVETDKNKTTTVALILLSQFLWFIPYLYSRFSSEILALLFLLYALYKLEYSNKENWKMIGLLLSFSFFARFQMAFAIVGTLSYILFIKKIEFKNIIKLALGFGLGFALNLLIDKQFYGEMVFTPWEYFRSNIIEGKAAGFGVSPFYQYGIDTFLYLIPLFSIILVPLALVGLWSKKTSIYSFIIVPFVLAHSLVGHKEIRFLFPMIFPFLILVYFGLVEVFQKKWFQKKEKSILTLLKVVFVLNLIILPVRSLLPAQESFVYFEKMYAISETNKSIFIGYQRPPFRYAFLPVNFYRSNNSIQLTASDTTDLQFKLDSLKHSDLDVYVISYQANDAFRKWKFLDEYYTILPKWMYSFNFNNWISRSRIWVIYKWNKSESAK